MASIGITEKFINAQKREAEAVVVTIPAVLNEGGGRTNVAPTYIQGGDSLVASVVEDNTLLQTLYISVDEAFPAGALLSIDIGGVNYATGVDIATKDLTVSTVKDKLFASKQSVTARITGITGDVETGVLRIILDTLHPNLKNGRYAS